MSAGREDQRTNGRFCGDGVPLIVVAKNLGHRDTRMVERHYGHLAQLCCRCCAGAPRFAGTSTPTTVVPMLQGTVRTKKFIARFHQKSAGRLFDQRQFLVVKQNDQKLTPPLSIQSSAF
jgi:hypothetical protein